MYQKGDEVEIIEGRHAGKRCWFEGYSRKPGAHNWVFVQFQGPAYRGAQVREDQIRPLVTRADSE